MQCGVQRMPAQTCALHAGWKFSHPGERAEFTECREIRHSILLSEQFVYLLKQSLGVGQRFAFDCFGEQRCRRSGDRAALTFETNIRDFFVLEIHIDSQAITAQRIVAIGVSVGRFELAEVSWVAIVIDDHIFIEIFEVHDSYPSRVCV
jgi:hypothetical protein